MIAAECNREQHGWRQRWIRMMNRENSFGIITTCNESPKQLREFVNYHLNLGASLILLYFDNPVDPGLDQFANEPRVISVRSDESRWNRILGRLPARVTEAQACDIREGTALLRERGIAWILSIDADELLHSERPVEQVLSGIDSEIDVVRALPVEAIQHNGMNTDLDFSSRYFRRFVGEPTEAQADAIKRFETVDASYTRGGLFGHVEGKALFRATATVDEYKVHAPRYQLRRLPETVSDELALIHFDAMSAETWKRKWIRRVERDTGFPGPGISATRAQQFQFLKDVFNADGPAGLERVFCAWYHYSPAAVTELSRAGVLRRIDLPASMFEGPVGKSVRS